MKTNDRQILGFWDEWLRREAGPGEAQGREEINVEQWNKAWEAQGWGRSEGSLWDGKSSLPWNGHLASTQPQKSRAPASGQHADASLTLCPSWKALLPMSGSSYSSLSG